MTRFILGLAMAPAATYRRVHIPVVDKFFSQFPLRGAGWGLPVEVGDLVQRAKMILRGTMALETPAHALGFGVVDDLHVIHLAVAGHATDAPVHVNCMVEVDVVRRLVNANPGNRIAGFPGFADRGQFWAQRFDLGVAVHAGLCPWNVGVGRFLHPSMAVTAIHSELVDVQRVIKSHRLRGLIAHPRVFGGKVICHARDHAGDHHGHTDQNLDREPVGPSWENIGHEG